MAAPFQSLVVFADAVSEDYCVTCEGWLPSVQFCFYFSWPWPCVFLWFHFSNRNAGVSNVVRSTEGCFIYVYFLSSIYQVADLRFMCIYYSVRCSGYIGFIATVLAYYSELRVVRQLPQLWRLPPSQALLFSRLAF